MKKKFTFISDTHNQHRQLTDYLPSADFLIHSGDLTKYGTRSEIEDFIDWFSCVGGSPTFGGFKYKVFIAGNHDLSFQSDELRRVKQLRMGYDVSREKTVDAKPKWLVKLLSELPANVFYLENYGAVIDGIKFWGIPNTPTFMEGWAFNTNRGYDMNEICNLIPLDTDILITHGPMRYHCDYADYSKDNVGCDDLYNRILEVKPHLHICGHIHPAYGYRHILHSVAWGGAWTFNAAVLNGIHSFVHDPIHIEYDFETRDIEFKM